MRYLMVTELRARRMAPVTTVLSSARGKEHLPSKAHQLVEPQPRKRGAQENKETDEDERLQHEPDDRRKEAAHAIHRGTAS